MALFNMNANRGTGVGVTAEIVRIDTLSSEARDQWLHWQKSNPLTQSPFFHPRFAEAVARHAPHCFVAKLFKDGILVGYFPFQKRGRGVYPIGAPMNDYHGVIGSITEAPTLEEVALAINARRLNVNGWVGKGQSGRDGTSCQVTLESGYEAWLASRLAIYGKYFKDKARSRRSMEAQMGPIEVLVGIKEPLLLDQLIRLKSAQFRRTGRHDIFAAGWTVHLLHDLMRSPDSDDLGASMATMSAGGELVAIEYSLHAGNHYHFWFPAYLDAGARFSPGILLSMETMKALEPEGYRVFDYGFGDEGYKKYFVNTYQAVREACVVAGRAGNWGRRAGARILGLAGAERAERLKLSIHRRWSMIEATEVSRRGRVKGVILAARRASGRIMAGES